MNTKSPVHLFTVAVFLINSLGLMPIARADDFNLPAPGVMVPLSPPLDPPMLKGIKVHPENPFKFDFILDQGNAVIARSSVQRSAATKQSQQEQLTNEATRLIKYFLASLTIPEKDLWVNLSPYEKDRIIPQSFGLTEMGRDLLAEDYMLKQITASLIYPEGETGKKFWKRIYQEAEKKFGTTNIPVNTFNKVWIIPDKAVVYENAKAGTAYIVESKLKVMLEQDYLSLEKNTVIARSPKEDEVISSNVIPAQAGIHNKNDINALGSQIVREVVIPELTREVNQDKNFVQLRQVYNSLILATWYKKKIRNSIINRVYSDNNKISGINIDDPQEKQKIYARYLQAFKKGVYNYIKEEKDSLSQQDIPRKYFSGGYDFTHTATSAAMTAVDAMPRFKGRVVIVKCRFNFQESDLAMHSKKDPSRRFFMIRGAQAIAGAGALISGFPGQLWARAGRNRLLNPPSFEQLGSNVAREVKNFDMFLKRFDLPRQFTIPKDGHEVLNPEIVREFDKVNDILRPYRVLLLPDLQSKNFRRICYIYENPRLAFIKDVSFVVPLDGRIDEGTGMTVGNTSVVFINELFKVARPIDDYLDTETIPLPGEEVKYLYRKQSPQPMDLDDVFFSLSASSALHEHDHHRSYGDLLPMLTELIMGPKPFFNLGILCALDKEGNPDDVHTSSARYILNNLPNLAGIIFTKNLQEAELKLRLAALEMYVRKAQRSFFDDTTIQAARAFGIPLETLLERDTELLKPIAEKRIHEMLDGIKDPKIKSVINAYVLQDADLFDTDQDIPSSVHKWFINAAFFRSGLNEESKRVNMVNMAIQETHDQYIRKHKGATQMLSPAPVVNIINNLSVELGLMAPDKKLAKKKPPVLASNDISGNQAMIARARDGGIDFQEDNVHMQVRNDGGEIKFYLDPAMLQELRNASGMVPIIVNIQSLPAGPAGMMSLKQFLNNR